MKINLINKISRLTNVPFLILCGLLLFATGLDVQANYLSGYENVGNTTNSENADKTYKESRFKVDGPVTLDVSTSGGHITVKEGSSDEVHVRLLVKSGYSFWGGSDFDPDDYKIMIAQNGNVITAMVESKGSKRRWGGNNPSFSFEITAPKNTTSSVRTSGGHISIEDLDGSQQIRTSGGHISIERVNGEVEARTSGGHIKVTDFYGDMDARTSGGHITLTRTNGNLSVRTSGGHINATDISGALSASTSGGNIQCSVNRLTNDLSLRTSGGNVRASIPALSDYSLNLRGNNVSVSNLENFSGTTERNRVIGDVGAGGKKIEMSTSGGIVSLTIDAKI